MSSDISVFSAEQYAQKQIARHRLISFDIFDTLLSRRVAKPVDVFALARLYLLDRVPASLARAADAFPELRVRAERAAREAAPGEHAGEITLDEIYRALGDAAGLDRDQLALLREAELAMELRVSYANPAGRRLFDFARGQGKPTILVSDMYLPSQEIARLLESAGYRDYGALYVSCETRRSKHLGAVFDFVARQYGNELAHPLHIGDNVHGDYVMPIAAGWSATHLPQPPPASERAPHLDADVRRGTAVASVVEGLLAKREAEGTLRGDPWEALGYESFGPLLAGFAIWLARNIRARKPDKVVFLARDAYFVREHVAKFFDEPPDSEYAFVSRGSLLLASFTDFPLSRLVHLISGRTKIPVRRHLLRLGIDPAGTLGAVRSAGFDGLDDLVANGDDRMIALLAKLHRELLQAAAARRGPARRYLEQCVGDARRVALVDIGWSGNMQGAAGRLLATGRGDVRIDGFYVGLLEGAERNLRDGDSMRAWLERAFAGDSQSIWWRGGIEILEFAMSAPHGTTLGYRETGDGVTPILENSDLSDVERSKLLRLQTGAALFIDDVLETYGDMTDALDSPAWAERFLRLVAHPTPAEADLLGEISHGDVAGDTSLRLPFAPRVTDGDDAAASFGRCHWKPGFIVRNGLSHETGFSEALYLEFNPDVRAAVRAGTFASGAAHYEAHGRSEGRVASWAQAT